MNPLLTALVLLLTVFTGWHAVINTAMPEMSPAAMAMHHSGASPMPADCASLCLSNAHPLVVAAAPRPDTPLLIIVGLMLGFLLVTVKLLSPRFTSLNLLAKPPDPHSLYGIYRI